MISYDKDQKAINIEINYSLTEVEHLKILENMVKRKKLMDAIDKTATDFANSFLERMRERAKNGKSFVFVKELELFKKEDIAIKLKELLEKWEVIMRIPETDIVVDMWNKRIDVLDLFISALLKDIEEKMNMSEDPNKDKGGISYLLDRYEKTTTYFYSQFFVRIHKRAYEELENRKETVH